MAKEWLGWAEARGSQASQVTNSMVHAGALEHLELRQWGGKACVKYSGGKNGNDLVNNWM